MHGWIRRAAGESSGYLSLYNRGGPTDSYCLACLCCRLIGVELQKARQVEERRYMQMCLDVKDAIEAKEFR